METEEAVFLGFMVTILTCMGLFTIIAFTVAFGWIAVGGIVGFLFIWLIAYFLFKKYG